MATGSSVLGRRWVSPIDWAAGQEGSVLELTQFGLVGDCRGGGGASVGERKRARLVALGAPIQIVLQDHDDTGLPVRILGEGDGRGGNEKVNGDPPDEGEEIY